MKKFALSTDLGFQKPRIDREFLELLPIMDEKEDMQLEAMLIEEGGARDPIIVWADENIVVEGHRRSRMCQKHGLPYRVEYKEFADREAVKMWMIRHQLHGRRNLTDFERSYFIGKEYLVDESQTAGTVAKKNKVSKRKVFRDATFAKAVDKHEKETPGAAKRILQGEAGKSMTKIIKTAPALCKRCTRVGAVKDCANCELVRIARAAKKLPAKDLFDEPEIRKKIKEETPPKDAWQELLDTVTKLSGLLTARMKQTGPHGEEIEEVERLRQYMTFAGLVEYPKVGGDAKFIALSGVVAVMQLSMKKGPRLKAPEVMEAFKKACGAVPYVPPKTAWNRKRG